MDVRRTDRKASLASVADELEMEEQGDGAKLLKSKVSKAAELCVLSLTQACRTVDRVLRTLLGRVICYFNAGFRDT